MKGAKDRAIRESVPPRREVNVQANGTDQKESAEGLDAIVAAAVKAALSNASTPVTVVATDGPFGRAGLTCSAVSSVCDTPPTIILCVNRQSYAKGIIKNNGVLYVNWLAAIQSSVSQVFAGVGSVRMEDRFNDEGWRSEEHTSELQSLMSNS